MKTILILFSSILFYNQILFAQLPPFDPNYKLVFEENFDSIGINPKKWSSIWNWNQGGSASIPYCNNLPGGILTSELNGYRKRNFENCTFDTLGTGKLTIVSKKETYWGWVDNWPLCCSDSCKYGSGHDICTTHSCNETCHDGDNVKFNYTTNMLISKETFRYGYYEIRCKIPKPILPKTNKGIGPNFWLWSSSSTVGWSEIDIFEFNGVLNNFTSNVHIEDIYGDTIHGIPNHPSPILVDFNTYHTFAALWTPLKIEFFLDNVLYATANKSVDKLIEMPLIIDVNLPLVSYCQLIDTNNTQFPHNYDIDYVRVYQLKSDCTNDYSICSFDNINYAHYKSISIGGNNCNIVVPNGKNIHLITSESVNIPSNLKVELGASFSHEIIPCFQSIHNFPTRSNSNSYLQPPPKSFSKRLNPIYHE